MLASIWVCVIQHNVTSEQSDSLVWDDLPPAFGTEDAFGILLVPKLVQYLLRVFLLLQLWLRLPSPNSSSSCSRLITVSIILITSILTVFTNLPIVNIVQVLLLLLLVWLTMFGVGWGAITCQVRWSTSASREPGALLNLCLFIQDHPGLFRAVQGCQKHPWLFRTTYGFAEASRVVQNHSGLFGLFKGIIPRSVSPGVMHICDLNNNVFDYGVLFAGRAWNNPPVRNQQACSTGKINPGFLHTTPRPVFQYLQSKIVISIIP